MPKIYFDWFVIETFARLDGASAFLETVEEAVPTLHSKEHSYLEQRAAMEGWEADEFFMERDLLNSMFQTWIPIYAAYSVVILYYSILETQLFAFADHLGKKRESKLRVKDMAGRGIDQAALFLERVISFQLKSDPAWCRLQDLQLLRNIIVHRGGKPGSEEKQKKEVQRLVEKYRETIELRKIDVVHEQVWIKMSLCRTFADEVEGFFERSFRSAGLPNRHWQLDG